MALMHSEPPYMFRKGRRVARLRTGVRNSSCQPLLLGWATRLAVVLI